MDGEPFEAAVTWGDGFGGGVGGARRTLATEAQRHREGIEEEGFLVFDF